jgi:hypothetical protein
MSLDQLAHRLDDRFRLLTGGSRTALPRHRTLRAVVDWSWELLGDPERKVLRRLAVFSGGASLEAAERVCAGAGVEPREVLELLTSLTEKSLVVAAGTGTPRYRLLGTVKEYAGHRLAEAWEADPATRAHLAYFTELAETAEPHLRRAEQLDWLATLEREHDNIGSAMRGALAAGQAHAAMRLGAAAGWYWWLGGHKAEGLDLLGAATRLPGEVPDDTKATVYALMTMFLNSGRSGEQQVAEWIHKAYESSLRSPRNHPAMGLVGPLERLLRAPEEALDAFAPLLGDEDPWVRALARLHLGKMRIQLGQGGRDADEYLEAALTEFRAIGERFGISFALTELADRIASRGDFTRACAYYEEAVGVVAEVGATEDVIRTRARQARLYWLAGEPGSSAAAIAEAERNAVRVNWPDALAELAFAKADLARWAGDPAEARRQVGVARDMLGDEAGEAYIRAAVHDVLGYLADDLAVAAEHRRAACRAASEAGHSHLIAAVLIGIADLATRRDRPGQAARLLGASAAVRGLRDPSHPDVARIEEAARSRLGDTGFAEAVRAGAQADWRQLAEVTLAS